MFKIQCKIYMCILLIMIMNFSQRIWRNILNSANNNPFYFRTHGYHPAPPHHHHHHPAARPRLQPSSPPRGGAAGVRGGGVNLRGAARWRSGGGGAGGLLGHPALTPIHLGAHPPGLAQTYPPGMVLVKNIIVMICHAVIMSVHYHFGLLSCINTALNRKTLIFAVIAINVVL